MSLQVGNSPFISFYYQDIIDIYGNDSINIRVKEYAIVLIDIAVAELLKESGEVFVLDPG